MTGQPALTSLYDPWISAVISAPIPREIEATCDRCVMLAAPDAPPAALHFDAGTKCCTFQPNLPNFLVGRILADESLPGAEGRAAVDARIARRVAVLPSGVNAGEMFGFLYRNVTDVFGRASSLRCPYLTASGDCGVWAHRPGVCATWYCKHVRGETSQRLWTLTERLLRVVEQELALWCMAGLGVGATELDPLDAPRQPHVTELEGQVDGERYRQIWGDWVGREREFYRQAAELVAPLGWNEVSSVTGPRVRILAGLVRDAFEHLESFAIPERLTAGPLHVGRVERGGYVVTSYSPYDPVWMADRLFGVLPYFDGRPTEDALHALDREKGVRMPASLLRRLVDFGVLKAVRGARVLPLTPTL